MNRPKHWGEWYWEGFDPRHPNAGADLAIVRKALNRAPGDVPELWRFYRVIVPDSVATQGYRSASLTAEHATLGLFGLHQQAQRRIMHDDDVLFGEALSVLRSSGKYSDEAIDRRVNAAATATSQGELIMHLRGLVTQLRSLSPAQPLNYTKLVEEIYDWNHADGQQRVRRRWGAQYYNWARRDSATSNT